MGVWVAKPPDAETDYFISFLFFISSLNIYTLFHKTIIYVSANLHNSLTIINDGTLNMLFKYAVNIVEVKMYKTEE